VKIHIIGCGLTGIVAANVLKTKGHFVEIFESRSHIGGNCYDSNLNGVLVHNYGPHIFHTNDEEVWEYVNRFTEFSEFKYCPLGNTKLGLIPLPYSLSTVKTLGRELSSEEIIDVIYKDYSEKQWGVSFDAISKSIITRVPILKNEESPSWYGSERYQGIPSKGYTYMMSNMLDGIKVHLNVKDNEWKSLSCDLLIYTGKIDDYFSSVYGNLPYRSLRFEHSVSEKRLQHHAINECNKLVDYTRIYDHSYFLNQKEDLTVITKEYPVDYNGKNLPFYPITFGEGPNTYKMYKDLADSEKGVIFLGRLATYKYLDMWVAIKTALNKVKEI
jgi:UDP-galactopyranose mutase